ncbi:MAG TPA: GNAT family N-acetyltransferase [Bryobacteraceae bacterium]|nr:GNAT family N-acetyltransferase [Bryobacteraceae bacterium]
MIELIRATPAQEPILANLIELYAHDFSEFHAIDLGEDGRYGYKQLPLYWIEADRHPFLIRVDGKLAGFVLVKRESDSAAWDMAEFFVARAYRRRGIGIEAAHEVWRRFPGPWQVRVMEANRSGYPFWERAIAAFTGQAIQASRLQRDGRWWRVFSFESSLGKSHANLRA